MNLRKPLRLLVLAVVAAGFSACHLCCDWHHHCRAPVRHCR
jgi:hypothetical protein